MEKKARKGKREPEAAAPFASQILRPPSKEFFRKLEPVHAIAIPPVKKVGKQAVVNEIKAYAGNWNDDIEKALMIPAKLYRSGTAGAIYFCSDEKPAFGSAIESLESGELKGQASRYGIAILSPSSTTRIILVDMKRRIIVREAVGCLHDRPQQKEWAAVAEAIKATATISGVSATNLVAAYDEGSLRSVKIVK